MDESLTNCLPLLQLPGLSVCARRILIYLLTTVFPGSTAVAVSAEAVREAPFAAACRGESLFVSEANKHTHTHTHTHACTGSRHALPPLSAQLEDMVAPQSGDGGVADTKKKSGAAPGRGHLRQTTTPSAPTIAASLPTCSSSRGTGRGTCSSSSSSRSSRGGDAGAATQAQNAS
eukprot:GHVU01235203.1.p1 GENE.GHVU01235203.1~~GHVU01235203.1.p1  ORF type:complete len:175 (-),score=35.52 GHVU01235203.1:124-648(-)